MKASAFRRALLLLSLSAVAGGCATAIEATAKIGAFVGEGTGVLSSSQADAIRKSSEPLAKTFEDVTPEQEYYLGRAVAADIAGRYPLYGDEAANRYLTVLGTALARVSEKPETFGGYHVQILDSAEINAFAAPGGFIFVTRGLLRLCKTEDEAAAAVAHEIGHLELDHGLKTIQSARLTTALTILALEGAKSANANLGELTEAFGDSISDITKTLVTKGYSRSAEYDADRAALRILAARGYETAGLAAMLREMERRMPPGGGGFADTHPSPEDRLDEIEDAPSAGGSGTPPSARQERFAAALGGI